MKRIFILYSFSIVDVHIFLYKFGQTLCSLTLTKSYMRSKKNGGSIRTPLCGTKQMPLLRKNRASFFRF